MCTYTNLNTMHSCLFLRHLLNMNAKAKPLGKRRLLERTADPTIREAWDPLIQTPSWLPQAAIFPAGLGSWEHAAFRKLGLDMGRPPQTLCSPGEPHETAGVLIEYPGSCTGFGQNHVQETGDSVQARVVST